MVLYRCHIQTIQMETKWVQVVFLKLVYESKLFYNLDCLCLSKFMGFLPK